VLVLLLFSAVIFLSIRLLRRQRDRLETERMPAR
jgi:hypothetical protein